MSRFKKCPKGHTYRAELPECPICNSWKNVEIPRSSVQTTQIIDSLDGESFGLKTSTDDEPVQVKNLDIDPHRDFTKTQIDSVDEDKTENETDTKKEFRIVRKLVGWLVTYSHDANGQDFRLYEGRNLIGREINCGIYINDKKVSSQHAILLYRNGKFLIKDNFSANGTFVNNDDIGIGDKSYELNDGDLIQVGDTVFVFKTTSPSKQ